ncbi:Integrase catalytic domain-containing protein [Citrus sinensis]|uniref:Integrase catalytic domain-containing protein n=1 Tax=Citrus sinensis TaxID=2711 RepID=A0ACB8LZZ3_CITSI|nr:Integrase catalytic domain-containing protein [Citrus sinensis]
MVEGEISRIGERSTETISGDTSGGRRDLSNRYSAPIIGGQKIDVEKFDGKINFGMWRREVMDALIQIDLDVVLKNKRHLYDEEIWDRMNEKACGQIRSCLTKEVKYLVKDKECVMTLWRTLKEKYLLKSPENRLHAMSQVYGFRMKHGVSMHDHVSRFKKLLADLKNLDEDIKNEVKAMILLHSLPEEYSHFVTTLIYGKNVNIFKDVCTTLTNLEIRNNNKNSERASSEALVSRDWAMEKKKKRGGKNSRSKSRSRNIARDESYVASSSEWILDTGATYHLCPIKEWFTDFSKLESGAVMMGNDQPCRTMGIGTIRLKMFDGMIRELKEVRFVPALKKNLISVGALEAKGYKVTIEDGTMKFTHGAMVILQGIRCHNMYYLKGGTTDEANVVEAHSDNTKLCHVQLGHAGEKSLQTLMRHRFLKAYYHVKDDKLDPRARKAIFVGLKGGVKGFKLWDLEDKKFMCSRDVTFDEASMMKASSSQQVENKTKEVLQRVEFDVTPYVPISSTSEKGSTMEVTPRVEEEVVSSNVSQNEETIDDVDNDDFIATMRPRREIKKHGWLSKDMVVAYALPVIDVDIPNTFSETLRSSESDQWKLAMEEEMKSLHQNQTWELVKLPKGKKPSGFKVAGKENHVCRRLLDETFIYLLLYVDDMLIASKNRDEIERLKKQLAFEFEMKDLGDAHRILGMEIRRDKKNESVWLTQKSYLKKVLERFDMDDKTKPVYTPLAPHFKLSSSSCPRSQEERDYMARVPYASVVGSFMYAMVCTRPDISEAVSMVSRYMYNPGKNQWLAVKWILRYLYGTVDVGLLFKKDCGQQCVGYCDSDFARDIDKRRSTTSYVFTLGGGPVSWRLILQLTIALSTTEAEYMAATEAVKEAIWLKGLLGDLGVIQENIAVFCDNQSAIFLAKNQTYHARTKHIDVKYHYVREIIESGAVLLKKIDTKDNLSDMLTKVVSGVKFQHCLKLIQILRLC